MSYEFRYHPIVSALFRDAHLKIVRANKHIADLNSAIVALQNTRTSSVKRNPHTASQELIHEVPNQEKPLLDLSLIVGDAIHNLHTALDYAWVSTIKKRAPSAESKHTKFPFHDTREGVEGALHGIRIDTICPKIFEFIVSEIQPYKGGKDGILYALHDFDISDKHLLLLELTPRVGIKGISIRDKGGQVWHGSGMPTEGPGPYVIAFDSDLHIEDKGQLTFKITIKEAGVFKGIPISDLLLILSKYVQYIVQSLERLSADEKDQARAGT
jgi:hypothetical protein